MKRTVSAMEARKRFGELLEDVSRGDEVVIERAGKVMGVVVPEYRYRALEESRNRLFKFIRRNQELNKDVPEEEIEKIIRESIAEVRATRRAKNG